MKILRHLAWILINFVENFNNCPMDCRRNFQKEFTFFFYCTSLVALIIFTLVFLLLI